MKKVIAVLSIFSALIFSSQSFAQNGFGAGSSFGSSSFSAPSFTPEEPFQEPTFGSGASFGKAGFVDADSQNKGSKGTHAIGLQGIFGLGIGGGMYYKYQQPASSNAPSYILDVVGGLIKSTRQVINYNYNSYNGYESRYLTHTTFTTFTNVDNILFWNLTPSLDFLDLDLGINLRLGTVAFIFNPMFYLNANFTIPDTGVHFLLTTSIGTIDYLNHDFKFSVAYEMDFLKSSFIPGIEFGGKLQPSINFLSHSFEFIIGAYIGIYGKF